MLQQQKFKMSHHSTKLALGYYEGAIEDAMAAVTNISDLKYKKLDAKAYFRAASASYKLKHFVLVERCLQAQLELTPGDQDAQALMKRNKDRLREQQQGRYDIIAIEKSVPSQPRVDAADYISNTVIRNSGPGRGRGLFATRDIELGDLVLAETAFCSVWGHDTSYQESPQHDVPASETPRPGNVSLWRETLTKATRNPARGSELLHLYSDYNGTESRKSEINDLLLTDAYQIRDIVMHNAFGVHSVKESEDESHEQHSSGIWIRASYMNHSCVPNTTRIVQGDLMMLHASRPIKKGEEITGSYIGIDRYDGRAEVLESVWGFRCDCPMCVADSRCPGVIRQNRADLSRSLENDSSLSIYDPGSVTKMEMLANGLADTYITDLYAGLPKVELIPWLFTLVLAYCVTGDTSKCFLRLVEALRALGFKVHTEGERIVKISPTANSILPRFVDELRDPVLEQAILAHNDGHTYVAKHLSEFARSLERVARGTDENALRIYNKQIERSSSLARSGTRGLVAEMMAMGLYGPGDQAPNK